MLSNSNRWSQRKKESGAEKMIKRNPIHLHNTQQKIADVKLHQTPLKHRAGLTSLTKNVTFPPPSTITSHRNNSFIYITKIRAKKTC